MKRRHSMFCRLIPLGCFQRKIRGPGGFTLAEVLISIAILSLLVLILLSITNSITSTVGLNWAKAESDQEARLVLDRLQIDFQNMLLRPDIDYEFIQQAGNDKIAFYATESGYSASLFSSGVKRIASVINYQIDGNTTGLPVFERGANDTFQWNGGSSGMVFSGTPSLQTSPSSITTLEAKPPLDVLNQDVFRFEVSFLLKNPASGTQSMVASLPAKTAISDVAAVVVTIATLDSHNREIVGTSTSTWNQFIAALPDASDGKSTAQTWKSQIESGTFATTAGIPKKAAEAVRVYERYFYLNSGPSSATLSQNL